MSDYKFWTPQEDNFLIKEISTGKFSYATIGKILNRSSGSCQRRAVRIGLKNKFKGGLKYSVNEGFWTPNPISAYWAGFSAADASIHKINDNSGYFCLELSSEDEIHLLKLKEQSSFTGPIKRHLRDNKFWHSKIVICNPQWMKDLEIFFNVGPNKTKRLAPPNLTDEYLKFCYLIGYIDGDGTISLNAKGDFFVIRFISCSADIINWCHEFLMSKFGHICARKKSKKVSLSAGLYPSCSFSGVRAVAIFDYLSKFNLPKLDRKWQQPRILEYVAAQKKRYPHFFSV